MFCPLLFSTVLLLSTVHSFYHVGHKLPHFLYEIPQCVNILDKGHGRLHLPTCNERVNRCYGKLFGETLPKCIEDTLFHADIACLQHANPAKTLWLAHGCIYFESMAQCLTNDQPNDEQLRFESKDLREPPLDENIYDDGSKRIQACWQDLQQSAQMCSELALAECTNFSVCSANQQPADDESQQAQWYRISRYLDIEHQIKFKEFMDSLRFCDNNALHASVKPRRVKRHGGCHVQWHKSTPNPLDSRALQKRDEASFIGITQVTTEPHTRRRRQVVGVPFPFEPPTYTHEETRVRPSHQNQPADDGDGASKGDRRLQLRQVVGLPYPPQAPQYHHNANMLKPENNENQVADHSASSEDAQNPTILRNKRSLLNFRRKRNQLRSTFPMGVLMPPRPYVRFTTPASHRPKRQLGHEHLDWAVEDAQRYERLAETLLDPHFPDKSPNNHRRLRNIDGAMEQESDENVVYPNHLLISTEDQKYWELEMERRVAPSMRRGKRSHLKKDRLVETVNWVTSTNDPNDMDINELTTESMIPVEVEPVPMGKGEEDTML